MTRQFRWLDATERPLQAVKSVSPCFLKVFDLLGAPDLLRVLPAFSSCEDIILVRDDPREVVAIFGDISIWEPLLSNYQ